MGKIQAYREKNSGGVAWYLLLDDSLAETGTWQELGYLGSGSFKDETGEDSETDEDGLVYKTEGERTVEYEQKIRQRDKTHIKLAVDTLRGKYFRFLKEETNQTLGGVHQYFLGAVCKAQPSLDWSRPGNEITFKVQVTENASAVTLGSLPTGMRAASAVAGNFTVGAKKFWDLIEAS